MKRINNLIYDTESLIIFSVIIVAAMVCATILNGRNISNFFSVKKLHSHRNPGTKLAPNKEYLQNISVNILFSSKSVLL